MATADPSLSLAERVDAACDSFEHEWRAGRRPLAEDYVAAAPESDRDILRSALAAVEAELKAGETASAGTSASAPAAPGATVARPADQSAEPNTVGRFEIRSLLGAGAFGRVYRAYDPSLDREVALKVPVADTLPTAADRDRFLKEARAAATVSHPNVCPIHEVGEHDGLPYIVMALVPGQTLADVLRSRKEPLPERQAAIMVRKIALALDAAHKKGVVHRDLKPANVMFDKERKDIVVMDFGLARKAVSGGARDTQSGVVMGTPAYMSPEQARGDSKDVGPEGDIFSLGIIMYELLTGERPFAGTAHEVIGQILLLDPEAPSERRPGVNPQLEAICLKAMAKEPRQRFASMRELANAVGEYLRVPASAAGGGAETARAVETKPDDGTEADLSTDRRKLAEVFDAISEDRKAAKAETAALVEAAAAKHRTPRWVFAALALLFVGGLAAAVAAIVFFTQNDKVKVTIELKGIDLADATLSFTLDDKPISAEELKQPIELKPGDHTLVVQKNKVPFKRFKIVVTGGLSPGMEAREESDPPVMVPPVDPKTGTPGDPKVEPKSDPEAGFVRIFNGKDLTGWGAGTKAEAFRVDAAGNLIAKSNPTRNEAFWLLTEKEYGDYVLRLEFQFDKPQPTPTHSSVAIRCGPDHVDGRGCRLEVQLRDTAEGALGTGALIFVQGSEKKPIAPVGELAPGAWHALEIELRDRRVKVTLNGKLVNDVDVSKFTGFRGYFQKEIDRKKGRIGLQSYREETRFRNIRVKELPAEDEERGFKSIFNGKDLSGWEAPSRPESFGVDPDGNLTAKGDTPPGGVHWLYTKKEYTDYVLRLEFKFVLPKPTSAASAITPRAALEKGATGARSARLRVPLRNLGDAPRTGSVLYTITDAKDPDPPIGELATGTWHTLELDVRGPRIKVSINGKLVNDVDLKKIDRTLLNKNERWAEAELDRKKGHIGILSWRNPVKYRNIRVKDLAAEPKGVIPANRVYEMRVYYAAPGKLDALHARFKNHVMKFFEKHGLTNVAYFTPLDNKENKLVFFLSAPNRESRDLSFNALAADPEWKKVLAESQKNGELVARGESRFLTATDYSPEFKPAPGRGNRVFVLQTRTATKGNLGRLNDFCRDHTMKLCERHGMTNVVYWNVLNGEKGDDDTLIFLQAHKSKDDMVKSFETLLKDPDWIAARDESDRKAGGRLVESWGVAYELLIPTNYSPLK